MKFCLPTSRLVVSVVVSVLGAVELLAQTPALDWVRERRISQRLDHAMCYAAGHERIVLFGGRGPNGAPLADTWLWDGVTWTERRTKTTPGGRAAHAMAHDLARNRTVLFGGGDDRTWEWDGMNWSQVTTTAVPEARTAHYAAFDPNSRRILMCGGGRYDSSSFTDSWSLGLVLAPTATAYGTGCPGSNGPLTLQASEAWLGNPAFRLELTAARPLSPCALVLAAQAASLPIGGCTLLVKDPFVPFLALSNWTGFAAGPSLTIPSDPALRGALLYTQAFVVDPSVPLLSLATSAGQKLGLGD